MAIGHVASSAPCTSQMYMSVPIGSCGSYDPVITLKPLWGSLGTELSTWSTGSLCCIRAIQHSRFASRPLRSYTAIQRYTALYTIQLYIAIHYTVQPLQHTSGADRLKLRAFGANCVWGTTQIKMASPHHPTSMRLAVCLVLLARVDEASASVPHASDIKLPGWKAAMVGKCRGGTNK